MRRGSDNGSSAAAGPSPSTRRHRTATTSPGGDRPQEATRIAVSSARPGSRIARRRGRRLPYNRPGGGWTARWPTTRQRFLLSLDAGRGRDLAERGGHRRRPGFRPTVIRRDCATRPGLVADLHGSEISRDRLRRSTPPRTGWGGALAFVRLAVLDRDTGPPSPARCQWVWRQRPCARASSFMRLAHSPRCRRLDGLASCARKRARCRRGSFTPTHPSRLRRDPLRGDPEPQHMLDDAPARLIAGRRCAASRAARGRRGTLVPTRPRDQRSWAKIAGHLPLPGVAWCGHLPASSPPVNRAAGFSEARGPTSSVRGGRCRDAASAGAELATGPGDAGSGELLGPTTLPSSGARAALPSTAWPATARRRPRLRPPPRTPRRASPE